ncbi:hypothetical protein ABZ281_30055 [Streptomyces sp. NPDC006265]|uniref:hypothetical protein n=1 Tax=Streptomyces sp. NPDC006265 TaxID=3156740 RepID=UPI0033A3012E
MVDPTPLHLSPEQREHLEQLIDASRLRMAQLAALNRSPKPPPRRPRTRQYPGGRPNPWRTARLPRRRQG